MQASAPVPWQLVRRAGQGGQAEVWLARSATSGEEVALKVVDAGQEDRLREELRQLMLLRHPSVVECRGMTEVDGKAALILEWIAGEPLDQVAHRLSPENACLVLQHLAHALAYLHGMRVVHRDVKPENVLVLPSFWTNPTDATGIKLVDFGIAVREGNPRPKTGPGGRVGTLLYIAPEVLLDGATASTATVDVFAWGVLGWEILAKQHPLGEPPREGSPEARCATLRRAYEDARDNRRPWPCGNAGDDRVATTLARCLSLAPGRRPRDGGDVCGLLAGERADGTAAFIPGSSSPATKRESRERARPAWIIPAGVAGVIAILAVAAVAAVPAMRPKTCDAVPGLRVMPPMERGRREAALRTDPDIRRKDNGIGTLGERSVVHPIDEVKGSDHERWLRLRVDCASIGSNVGEGKIGWTHAVNVPESLTKRTLKKPAPLYNAAGALTGTTVAAGVTFWIITPDDERVGGQVRVRVSEPETVGYMRETDLP